MLDLVAAGGEVPRRLALPSCSASSLRSDAPEPPCRSGGAGDRRGLARAARARRRARRARPTGPPSGPASGAATVGPSVSSSFPTPAARLAHPRPGPRLGGGDRAAREPDHRASRRRRGDLPGSSATSWPTSTLHEAVRGRVPLWFDEGYAGWAAGEWERFGIAGAQSLRGSRGAAHAHATRWRAPRRRLHRRRRLRAGRLGRHRAGPAESLGTRSTRCMARLVAGDDFEAAVLATTGLDARPVRGGVAARASGGGTRLVTWLLAGGGWLVMPSLSSGWYTSAGAADRDRRAALDEGWVVEPETEPGPELDPTRDRW